MTASRSVFRGGILFLIFTTLILGVKLPASGDITGLTCTFGAPTDLAKKYNSGQPVSIRATWTGDTPPFAATFKANSIPIGTVNTTQGQAEFSTSAGALVEGPNNFAVSILETAVPNANASPDTPAAGTLQIDRIAPTVTVNVLSGAIVSPQTGFNEVVISVTSSEDLGEAPKFTITPGTWSPPAPVNPEAPPFSSNQYKILVPANTPAGAYTVRVSCRDNTEPAASRNEGTSQTAFQVDSTADGSPAILSSAPKSPIRTESVLISGSVPSEPKAQKVELLEGSTVVGTVTVPPDTDAWSVSVTPVAEGSHAYSARRTDPLGNVSPGSAEMTIIADRTPPHEPHLDQPKTPVNTIKIKITGSSVTDPPHNSGPLKVTLYSGSTPVASAVANTDGSFTFTDVPLSSAQNAMTARAADTTWNGNDSSGNSTGYSNMVNVVLDTRPPVIVSGGIVIGRSGDSPPSVVFRGLDAPARVEAPPGTVQSQSPKTSPTPTSTGVKALQMRSASESFSVSAAFQPPMGDWPYRLVPVELPVSVIRDRNPDRVRIWVAFRKWGQPICHMNLVPMTRGGGNYSGFLPNAPEPLFYRFRLVDAAGNESFFPTFGEFYKPNLRCGTLRMVSRPHLFNAAPAEDVWPVESLGMPGFERLSAYRRIIVSPALKSSVQSMFERMNGSGTIEILEDSADEGSTSTWRRDLDLLETGKLPRERLDILLSEIVNGEVPLNLLPDPDRLPKAPEFGPLRDAIQFRHLHDPSP
ncbi:hypothetical protein AUK22_06915 [bacterium CG2_30_54_10]|nr:MAG: hypothetical protein AUK22_06915 [bacterium CG2_30_54_10]